MTSNGDTDRQFQVGNETVCGLGSFHKTLKHNEFGEVDNEQFQSLVAATKGDAPFSTVGRFDDGTTRLTNPQAGLAKDHLTNEPFSYNMPPAPSVLSLSTATEMTELYWMACLRDVSFTDFESSPLVCKSAEDLDPLFKKAVKDTSDAGHLRSGIDLPGSAKALNKITVQNVFRMGLPGEEIGPLVSQFFIRDVPFGVQKIDQRLQPYASGVDYLTDFDSWLGAQNTGKGVDGNAYPQANEAFAKYYVDEGKLFRHIATMRDLARFVNKDALHQAYFNGALLLLSGGAKWNQGNPYGDHSPPAFGNREAGFGTLGGPHILALVSEVATRALKIVWFQKWQTHLRLRPEAYGGLAHVQFVGAGPKKSKRPYGLPAWLDNTDAAKAIKKHCKGLLLPMAFTSGSPTHPAYGAGHATVAGACVTVLKAYFKTFNYDKTGNLVPVPLKSLVERTAPHGKGVPFKSFITGKDKNEKEICKVLPADVSDKLTIEGELNKLASNVAMGRSMGGVHWRSDNTRSLILGEAIAAQILADITIDLNEKPQFGFRSFARDEHGNPKLITIQQGQIRVNGVVVASGTSAL